jgi:hypothetical protein
MAIQNPSLEDELIETIKRLPGHQQVIVKALVDTLARRSPAEETAPQRGWLGCLEHLGVSITAEEIDEARRELWGSFAQEIDP